MCRGQGGSRRLARNPSQRQPITRAWSRSCREPRARPRARPQGLRLRGHEGPGPHASQPGTPAPLREPCHRDTDSRTQRRGRRKQTAPGNPAPLASPGTAPRAPGSPPPSRPRRPRARPARPARRAAEAPTRSRRPRGAARRAAASARRPRPASAPAGAHPASCRAAAADHRAPGPALGAPRPPPSYSARSARPGAGRRPAGPAPPAPGEGSRRRRGRAETRARAQPGPAASGPLGSQGAPRAWEARHARGGWEPARPEGAGARRGPGEGSEPASGCGRGWSQGGVLVAWGKTARLALRGSPGASGRVGTPAESGSGRSGAAAGAGCDLGRGRGGALGQHSSGWCRGGLGCQPGAGASLSAPRGVCVKGETSQQVMPLPLRGQTGAAPWVVALGMRRPDQGWCGQVDRPFGTFVSLFLNRRRSWLRSLPALIPG